MATATNTNMLDQLAKQYGVNWQQDPIKLAGILLSLPAKEANQQNLAPYLDSSKSIFQPMYNAQKSALSTALGNIGTQGEMGKRNVETAYGEGLSNLNQMVDTSRKNARNTAIRRGTYDSGTFDAALAQVDKDYNPKFENLEARRGTDLSNLESELNMLRQNLAQKETELEAGFTSDINKYAMQLFGDKQRQEKEQYRNLAQYLSDYATRQENQKRWQAEQERADREWQQKLKEWDTQIEQWNKNYALDKYSTYNSGGGGKTPSVTEMKYGNELAAASQIARLTSGEFYRPVDFGAQMTRDFQAGKIDAGTYNYVMNYLNKNYGEDMYQKLREKKKKTPTVKEYLGPGMSSLIRR